MTGTKGGLSHAKESDPVNFVIDTTHIFNPCPLLNTKQGRFAKLIFKSGLDSRGAGFESANRFYYRIVCRRRA